MLIRLHFPELMKKKIWQVSGLILAVIIIGSSIVLWQKDKTVEFTDESTGVSFRILEEYKQEFREDKQPQPSNKLVAHFVRTEPSALITVRYETGLRKVKNLLRRSSSVDHFMAEIPQFFPIKYEGYQFVSLEKREQSGQEFVEHVFTYKDKDDTIKVRLLIYPYLDDAAYYILIQSKEQDFAKVAKDLDVLRDSVKLTGPKQ